MMLRSAFADGGPVAATVGLLAALDVAAEVAPATPLALLTWLREPVVNERIEWRQDILVAADYEDPTGVVQELAARADPINVIAFENQWLWQAHLPAGSDSQVAIINEEAGEHFGNLDLGEFLLRMVVQAVTGRRSAFADRWALGPVSGVDPARLLGPTVVDITGLALPQVALGDGWLYSFGHDATTGTLRALVDPADREAADHLLAAAATELGGQWAQADDDPSN
jgi:hypothetical protein